jgi:hypothetical protein
VSGRPDQPPPRLRRSAVASAKAEGLRYIGTKNADDKSTCKVSTQKRKGGKR